MNVKAIFILLIVATAFSGLASAVQFNEVKISDAWTEQVLVTPAWNETVLVKEGYIESVLVMAGYNIEHPAIYTTVEHPTVYETVDHPAVYKTVTHPAVYEEQLVREVPQGYFNNYCNSDYQHAYDKAVKYAEQQMKVHDYSSYTIVYVKDWGARGHFVVKFSADVLVTDAWDEEVLVSQAWTEDVLVSQAWNEDVLVMDAWTEVIDPVFEDVEHPPVFGIVEHPAIFKFVEHAAEFMTIEIPDPVEPVVPVEPVTKGVAMKDTL